MSEPVTTQETIEFERQNFRRLLAINPNYFGTVPDVKTKVVFPKQGDTTYEELGCVGYSPDRGRLEATVRLKKTAGYSGNLCSTGSYEYVRFFVSYNEGTTWQDAGVASVNVHDLPPAEDCQKQPVFPLSYVVGLDFVPKRNRCSKPVLPLVKAILSWHDVPTAGDPGYTPVWGQVRTTHVQITPRPWFIGDLVSKLSKDLLAEIPEYVLTQPPKPIPDPGPVELVPLEALAETYAKADVPLHRFALPHLAALADTSAPVKADLIANAKAGATIAEKLKVDLSEIVKLWNDGKGDVTYEELFCVGLDNNTDQLVATFQIKRPSGFSGTPCTSGSTEYVAFWADFGSKCTYTYLGTVPVNTHDYADLPAGGLTYSAVLPVDLGKFRRNCETPIFGRVRAVLSWGTPASTSNPDAVPVWGNRLDTHVQLRPGRRYDGTALFTHVGGVDVDELSVVTGLTLPGAHLAVNGTPLPDSCPFYGNVVLRGVLDPALAGRQYRVLVRDVTAGGVSTPLTAPFYVTPVIGPGYYVTPGADGWTSWPSYAANTDGVLGYHIPGGNDQWEISLELFGDGIVDVRSAQMDNKLRSDLDPSDPDNAGDLRLFTNNNCRWPIAQPLNGRFVARDEHFYSWSISVIGGPDPSVPPTPLTTSPPILSSTETPFSGTAFTLDLSALKACGYVVRLLISDRSIVDSAYLGHTIEIDKGICLE